ncbi:MAG: hypothetical protein WCF90_01385 [Methanomicrobiales archaeon]
MIILALYYYALTAFCILSLFVGIGHAAAMSTAAGNLTKIHGSGNGHAPRSRINFSCLEQLGVTLADLQAAKERNDTSSFRKLLDTCRPAQAAIAGNVMYRQPKNCGKVTGSVERNGTKVFPTRNLSTHRIITGMTPESFAGNMSTNSPGQMQRSSGKVFSRMAQFSTPQ